MISILKLLFVLSCLYLAFKWVLNRGIRAIMRETQLFMLVNENGEIDDPQSRYIQRKYVNDYGWHGKFYITEWARVVLLRDGTFKMASDWFRAGPEFKGFKFQPIARN